VASGKINENTTANNRSTSYNSFKTCFYQRLA